MQEIKDRGIISIELATHKYKFRNNKKKEIILIASIYQNCK